MFLFVVHDRRLKCFHAHHGAVHFFFRQFTEGIGNIPVGDLGSFIQRQPLDQFRQNGAGCNGTGTAEGLKLDVTDPFFIIQTDRDLECIAAGHVADFCFCIGIFDGTHIPGVQEVIHHFICIVPHGKISFPCVLC